ncbi:MAG: HEPN domain-containing protein [Anaerolineae bacterium]|nr:HEPN domain-containing protein [Anaerolineae bacterium]
MNELTLEWVQKAENDFVAAAALLKLKLETMADAICFHCQQCAEKYAKAYLHYQSVEFPRTHNLSQLLLLCEERDNSFSTIALEMQALNSYSIETRYPGRFATIEEAAGAVETVETVRVFIRSKLGMDKI